MAASPSIKAADTKDEFPRELQEWDGKSSLTVHNTNYSICIKAGECMYLPQYNNVLLTSICKDIDTEKRPVISLDTIYVQPHKRKQGIASQIIKQIDAKMSASAPSLLVVGPIIDETSAIERISKVIGGFRPCMPWSLIKEYPTAKPK